MEYGKLLSRAWNIIWAHKFLILLGVLVTLGSAGGGGNTGYSFGGGSLDFRPPEGFGFEFRPPDVPEGISVPVAVAAIIAIASVAVVVGMGLWVLSTVPRGGLIAGASAIDTGRASSFGKAFRGGRQKGWTLLGIGILPAIPGFILSILVAVGVVAYSGVTRVSTGRARLPSRSLAVGIVAVLVCFLVPIALVLGLLRTFANRACMLEDSGVFAAYKRGFSVLMENFGPALVLFLIQMAVSIGIGVVMRLPSIVMALCCVLWPVLILVQSAIAAYFSTLWTLAWRQWKTKAVQPTLQAG
jgi:hypothetical protein